jgi:mRNA-degrading endonuclease YafQ of YafQ-DinJ toxin-antitoxin module
MHLEVQFSKQFDKQLRGSIPEVQKAFGDSLQLLLTNKYHFSLNNHLLAGRFIGYRSINVIDAWRAIYREMYGESGIIVSFEVLGKQSELFK